MITKLIVNPLKLKSTFNGSTLYSSTISIKTGDADIASGDMSIGTSKFTSDEAALLLPDGDSSAMGDNDIFIFDELLRLCLALLPRFDDDLADFANVFDLADLVDFANVFDLVDLADLADFCLALIVVVISNI